MPYIAGLHFFIALFFAVHAVRSGQPIFWLIILFSFPLLGSIVYFFAIYLPASRLKTGAKRAVAATIKVLDPERDLREAQEAFEVAPTAQNQIRLAQALRSSCRVPREHNPVTDGHLGSTSGGSVRQLFAPGNVLVDAFHIINPGAASVGYVTTGATSSSPTTAQRGSGAGVRPL